MLQIRAQSSRAQPHRLLLPEETPAVGALKVPEELYQVLDDPAPLAGAMLPSNNFPWDDLHALGYRWVCCLCSEKPQYTPGKLRIAYVTELHDFSAAKEAPDPVEELRLIRSVVLTAHAMLGSGKGVLVHCAGGRGRTSTVIGGVLVRLGHKPEAVIQYLDALHKRRGRSGWPEAPWQADAIRHFARQWNRRCPAK